MGSADSRGNIIVNGDGDGIIRSASTSGVNTTDCFMGNVGSMSGVYSEVSQLFLHLNAAQLGRFASDGNSNNVGTGSPYAQLGNGIIVTCTATANWSISNNFSSGHWILAGIGIDDRYCSRIGYRLGLASCGGGNWMNGGGIPVSSASMIDAKTDDGNPSNGTFGVLVPSAVGCVGGTNSYTPTATTCSWQSYIISSNMVMVGKKANIQ